MFSTIFYTYYHLYHASVLKDTKKKDVLTSTGIENILSSPFPAKSDTRPPQTAC